MTSFVGNFNYIYNVKKSRFIRQILRSATSYDSFGPKEQPNFKYKIKLQVIWR